MEKINCSIKNHHGSRDQIIGHSQSQMSKTEDTIGNLSKSHRKVNRFNYKRKKKITDMENRFGKANIL